MPKLPNIVFIMADDLGYADVACYGRPGASTPNIDRIAARGVRLTQRYANSAVCSATRGAPMTGRYQYRLPLGLKKPLARKRDVACRRTIPPYRRCCAEQDTARPWWANGTWACRRPSVR